MLKLKFGAPDELTKSICSNFLHSLKKGLGRKVGIQPFPFFFHVYLIQTSVREVGNGSKKSENVGIF